MTLVRTRGPRVGAPPRPLLVPAVVGGLFLVLPTLGLVIRAPWRSLGASYRNAHVLDTLGISLVTATEATVVCVLLGIPLATALARSRMPGRRVVRALVMLPLVVPPVVGGVALFLALGRNGYLGRYLDEWFGLALPFTRTGIVIAQAFVAMPFLVVAVEGALRSADAGLDEAAATLGASPWRVFSRVTLPLVLPSVAAGTVLCWARALGEFGATVLFGGNIQGLTRTLPTEVVTVFNAGDESDAVAVSLPLLFVAVVVIAGLGDRWLRQSTAPAS
jgi:molybdate transport system permease protein